MATHSKTVLATLLAANLAGHVQAHGLMTTPASRNIDHSCGHCLNAGGPGSVYGDGYTHGMCGNGPSESPQDWNEAGDPTPIGVSGDSFLIEIKITAHHMGYFEFELCDSPDITEDCFRANRLFRSDCDPDVEGEQTCRRWWKPLKTSEYNHYSLTKDGGVGYPDGSPYIEDCNYVTYGMMYDIPEDMSCTHCVLRWHWYTTNSCTASSGTFDTSEEFWNCADVSVEAPEGETTVDTTPEEGYDAMNDRLTSTLPQDLSGDRVDDDNWSCPDPSYGYQGDYTCSLTGDPTGTEGCYSPTSGETCSIGFYSNDNVADPDDDGIPEISYCTWSSCESSGVGGSEYCDESEDRCEGCGGTWCSGWDERTTTLWPYTGEPTTTETTTTTTTEAGEGYCAWYECTGTTNNEWCDENKDQCEGACNGNWCPTDSGDDDDDGDDETTTTTQAPATTTTKAPDTTTTTSKPTVPTTTTEGDDDDDGEGCNNDDLVEEVAALSEDVAAILAMVEEMKAAFDSSVCSDPAPTTTTTTTTTTLARDITPIDLFEITSDDDVADWTLVGPDGATASFSNNAGGIRLRNGNDGGETDLRKFAEGSAKYPFFQVEGTIEAQRLENDDFCRFEASLDGEQTWQTLLELTQDNDEDGVGTEVSTILYGNEEDGISIRTIIVGNGKYDDCILQSAKVIAMTYNV